VDADVGDAAGMGDAAGTGDRAGVGAVAGALVAVACAAVVAVATLVGAAAGGPLVGTAGADAGAHAATPINNMVHRISKTVLLNFIRLLQEKV
jgi:hypothetical protein